MIDFYSTNTLDAEIRVGETIVFRRRVVCGFYKYTSRGNDLNEDFTEAEDCDCIAADDRTIRE